MDGAVPRFGNPHANGNTLKVHKATTPSCSVLADEPSDARPNEPRDGLLHGESNVCFVTHMDAYFLWSPYFARFGTT